MANEEPQAVRVWNVTRKNGTKIRVATIEQGARKEGMCEGCSAPCCRGSFRPILNQEEFLTKKFPSTFTPPEDWLKEKVPRAEYLVTLAVSAEKGCPYFDSSTRRCSIWPACPKACLAYDCRGDPRPEIREFAKRREREWLQQ